MAVCAQQQQQLAIAPSLIAYLQQLDEHKKKCELSGRYAEAAAAAARTQELRAAEAQRLRGLLGSTQQQELACLQRHFQVVSSPPESLEAGACSGHAACADVCVMLALQVSHAHTLPANHTTNKQESADFDAAWRGMVAQHEAAVAAQLAALKQQHELQLTDLLVACEHQRPSRPQHSCEILNSRKIEEALVKQVGASVMCRVSLCMRSATACMAHARGGQNTCACTRAQGSCACSAHARQGEYRRAHEVKKSTDALYSSELAAAQQAWELGVELKRSKLAAKQQGARPVPREVSRKRMCCSLTSS
jgi:hypothetical protein